MGSVYILSGGLSVHWIYPQNETNPRVDSQGWQSYSQVWFHESDCVIVSEANDDKTTGNSSCGFLSISDLHRQRTSCDSMWTTLKRLLTLFYPLCSSLLQKEASRSTRWSMRKEAESNSLQLVVFQFVVDSSPSLFFLVSALCIVLPSFPPIRLGLDVFCVTSSPIRGKNGLIISSFHLSVVL